MTTVTVGDLIDVAVPNGSPNPATERAGARTRVRARVPATVRDNKAVRVGVETAATVRADLAGSWLLHNRPPSLAQVWAHRLPDVSVMPGQSRVLWWFDVIWRHVWLLPYGLLFAYLWLLHRAVTGVPTVLVTAALSAMWINAGGVS